MKKEIIACALLLVLIAGCVCNIRYLNRLCTQLDNAAAQAEARCASHDADSAAETPVPSGPSLAAQTLPDTGQPTQYLLRDEGGMVAVYTCGPDGSPTRLARQTDIYVNLLPENDALRVKQGMTVTGDAALQEVLEDLGG